MSASWDDERVPPVPRTLRRDDRRRDHWCHCDRPQPRPTGAFGIAMGGFQECAACGMPVVGSDRTNPIGRKR